MSAEFQHFLKDKGIHHEATHHNRMVCFLLTTTEWYHRTDEQDAPGSCFINDLTCRSIQ